jgi:Spy/CpxP family protein refolding chaperone
MKKKKLLIAIGLIVVLAVLAVASVAFAATSDAPAAQAIRGFCGFDASELTDQQNADLNDSYQKMMDLRKESINKMVENGTITKEQGDAALKRIDDMVKYRQENGTVGGRCGSNGCTFTPNASN